MNLHWIFNVGPLHADANLTDCCDIIKLVHCGDFLLVQLLVPHCCKIPHLFLPMSTLNTLIFDVPKLPAIQFKTKITEIT